jgi:hypothetical protein
VVFLIQKNARGFAGVRIIKKHQNYFLTAFFFFALFGSSATFFGAGAVDFFIT